MMKFKIVKIVCVYCNGTGQIKNRVCSDCNGYGKVKIVTKNILK